MSVQKGLILRGFAVPFMQVCGIKNFKAPPKYDNIEFPEKPKLRFVDKLPQLPPSMKAPKMQKRLRYMRGPETAHNYLLHKQFGIIALGGGRLRWGHFEMMRLTIGRKMDTDRMFAVWRVDSPWQPITKRGQGTRMGGGKGPIDHYVTPVKTGRVILEMGGKCDFEEVRGFLDDIANKLPFKAMAVTHEMLSEIKEREQWEDENNQNPYTMKYLIQNNMGGCHRWLSPFDLRFLGKYI